MTTADEPEPAGRWGHIAELYAALATLLPLGPASMDPTGGAPGAQM